MIHLIESELNNPGAIIDSIIGFDHEEKVSRKVEHVCMDDIRIWLVEVTSGATFATMVNLGYDQ